MKVMIVTCFESNEERVNYIYDACLSRGYDVKAISSDFSHIRKEKRDKFSGNIMLLEAKPYKKNMSVERMLSHHEFAKDAFALLSEYKPDLIWLIAPANSLIAEADKYKKRNPETKMIIDIIDMWPESLPVDLNKNILPFNIWRNIRSNHINCADHLVTECDFYHEILSKEYKGKIDTIYWARNNKDVINDPKPDDNKLNLVYIGSINNIIDTQKIKSIIQNCDKEVVLHVIGEGENTDSFINELKEVCEVIYHGAIRDEKEKSPIFDKCHAGINVYRDNLYIGFTTKCIDYFEHGLPIINNIKGDTWKMVEEYDAGINITDDMKINSDILTKQRKNYQKIVDLYNRNFTKEVFTDRCLKVIDEVMG
ncbi:MAG: hypothetical protein IJH00_00265 [Erysipelotrichaceae bacterium]|nr:hypothetical protein [Erysipelotrichaceae bacterium]MBQ6494225.1 hypothetical protein [Erysipelotrichaceae bacterium]